MTSLSLALWTRSSALSRNNAWTGGQSTRVTTLTLRSRVSYRSPLASGQIEQRALQNSEEATGNLQRNGAMETDRRLEDRGTA
jgi:hypothetical protein